MSGGDYDADDYFASPNVYQTEQSSAARGKSSKQEDADVDAFEGFDDVEGFDGFYGYIESTVDPGPWLLITTCCVCFVFMLIVVPGLMWFYNSSYSRRRRKGDDETIDTETCCSGGSSTEEDYNDQTPQSPSRTTSTKTSPVPSSLFTQVLAWDTETRKILRLAIPYTISALTTSVFSNTCLILVSMQLGVKSVAAYALVQVLCGLSDGVAQAPIYACTTLCAQAVGAGNPTLAGNRIQMAIILFMVCQVPVILFWWYYMYETILFLEWGDTAIAQDAQDFVRVYIFSYTFGGLSSAVWQLLEVTGHAADGTIINTLWGGTNVVLIAGRLIWWNNSESAVSLADVAWVYNWTSVLFISITLVIASCRGWLTPFWKGLIGSTAMHNPTAVRSMLRQAIPLAASSFLSNAEWAVLTLLASYLGPAEVAAWALLGSIWDIFYSVTAGIGDAAEIRVAFHLGNGSGSGARLSAYKSLFLGMVVASVVSLLYFSLQNRIPTWFTTDVTLQNILRELVPFVGVANLTMTFGMQCWSLIGAQGKYKYATWVSCLSSWGVCMPLAAFYVFILRLDLQGLTSAVVLGYLATGSALSYKLLSTNWDRQARKIQGQNSDAAMGKESSDSSEEQPFIALRAASSPTQSAGQRKVQLITLPAGQRPGLVLGNIKDKEGVYVLDVRRESPIYFKLAVGDAILSIDGVLVSKDAPHRVSFQLEEVQPFDRQLTIMCPPADIEDSLLVDGGCICWDDNLISLEKALLDDNIKEGVSCEIEHRSTTPMAGTLLSEGTSRELYPGLNETPSKSSDPSTSDLPCGCHHPSDECSTTHDFNATSEADDSYHAMDAMDGYVVHKATKALVRVDDRCNSRNGDLSLYASAKNSIEGLPTDEDFSINDDQARGASLQFIESSHSVDCGMPKQGGQRDQSTDPCPATQSPSGHHLSVDSTQLLYDTDSLCRAPENNFFAMDSQLKTNDMIAPSGSGMTDGPASEDIVRGQESTDPDFSSHSQYAPIDTTQVLYETDSLHRSLEEAMSPLDSAPTENTVGTCELRAIETTSDDDSQCTPTPEESERATSYSSWEEIAFQQGSPNDNSPDRRSETGSSPIARPRAPTENTAGSPLLQLQPEYTLRAKDGKHYTIPLPMTRAPIPEMDHSRSSSSHALSSSGPRGLADVIELCTSTSTVAEEAVCESSSDRRSRETHSFDDGNDSSSTFSGHEIV